MTKAVFIQNLQGTLPYKQIHTEELCYSNMFTKKTLKNKIKMHPDLAQQPSALSALSAVVPSGEPPEAASPPFLHHTLCLKEIAPEKMCIFLYYYI